MPQTTIRRYPQSPCSGYRARKSVQPVTMKKKKPLKPLILSISEVLVGAPGRIRTCDHPLRRRMLYPTELRALTGRGREIRTPDILLPKQARYQTALYPELAQLHWKTGELSVLTASNTTQKRCSRQLWTVFFAQTARARAVYGTIYQTG